MRRTCINCVYELAQVDPRVLFVGSDLGAGVLDPMKEAMPDRFFMEGVAEANLIGMAAGLAMDGFVPYVNTIATFLTRRCFEQIAIDLCMHNLPVRLIGNGGGVVYAPLGPTHEATDDIGIMRTLPNMTVVAVSDAEEMKRFMVQTLDWEGPIYIRLGKGGDPVVSREDAGFKIGRAIQLTQGSDVGFVTTGVMASRCLEAGEQLKKQGVDAGVLHVHTLKPLDDSAVQQLAASVDLIVTVEEHSLVGGLGSAVLECLADTTGRVPPILRLGLPDRFPDKYGSQAQLLEAAGLSPDLITGRVLERRGTA